MKRRFPFKIMMDSLHQELRAYPKKKVDRFFAEITVPLHLLIPTLQSDYQALYSENIRISRLKRMTKATSKFLEDGFLPALASPHPLSVSIDSQDTLQPISEQDKAFYRAQKKAHAAARAYLEQLKRAGTSAHPANGRPKAGEDGVFARVAYVYEEVLGEPPSTTPGSTFSNVVLIMLRCKLGRTPKDVRRHVSAAVSAARMARK